MTDDCQTLKLQGTLNLIVQFSDLTACKTICQAIIWIMMIGIVASDLIFNLRVWAIWRKTRTMAIILITLNISFLTPVWVAWGLFVNSLECLLPLAGWAVLLTYQTVMLSLMLPPAFTAFGYTGIIYYIYLIHMRGLLTLLFLAGSFCIYGNKLRISPKFIQSQAQRIIISYAAARVTQKSVTGLTYQKY
ncbi:hypothetical protein BDQ17DRAFT_1328824 [Cyathus striatus]|nr:hypothetical protein BDQ17DRAFT_1328824 [Cyathus striatus]